ncbi:MAG: cardiolipin synthase [Acidiferrobacterales bacterium]
MTLKVNSLSGAWQSLAVLALIASLAGCASFPGHRESARMRVLTRESPIMVGPDGPLSAQRSEAIIAGMRQQVPPTNILSRQSIAAQECFGPPLAIGNQATLFVDEPTTYDAIFKAIESARDSVDLETYIFGDDLIGKRLLDLLLKKQRAGVQVNVIYDSIGSIDTPDTVFDPLRAEGARVLEFSPINPFRGKMPWSINRRDHRKIVVVDGRIAFTGGVNVSDERSRNPFRSGRERTGVGIKAEPWRDTDVEVEGPAVAQFQRLFMDTWERQRGPALPPRDYFPPSQTDGDDIIHVIGSGPGDGSGAAMHNIIVAAINDASRYVHITTAYFVPDHKVLLAMKRAAKRGVDVTLIVPGFTDSSAVFYAGRSYYTTLLKAGVKVYERHDVLLHAKSIVIDGVWSTVGSTNMDLRSFFLNDEVNAIVLGKGFATQMEALFQKDLQSSNEILLSRWKQRPFFTKIKEDLSRLVRYWL